METPGLGGWFDLNIEAVQKRGAVHGVAAAELVSSREDEEARRDHGGGGAKSG
jgi:hypothetical protein